jgi:hypothetical protein
MEQDMELDGAFPMSPQPATVSTRRATPFAGLPQAGNVFRDIAMLLAAAMTR